MNKKVLLSLSILMTLACGLFATPTPTNSGVTGKVLVGPMCPVTIEGQECPDQSYQATLTVNNPDGREIVQFQTDEQGNFSVPLAPGEYILHPETPKDAPLPFADEQRFTVREGEYTRLTVQYDSGIR
ncbi:MAG: hypothetical protein PVJ21_16615 [Anaerolineales bacterium]